MSFLKELYDGEIRPCEEIPDTDEFKAAQSALSKAAKELDEALTAEQKNCSMPIRNGSSSASISHTPTHIRWAFCTVLNSSKKSPNPTDYP